MIKTPVILCVHVLFVLSCAQILAQSAGTPLPVASKLDGPELANASFLVEINNYFGCKSWVGSVCRECSFSYVFNKNGVCCLIDQNCKNFNRQIGVCQLCYEGYAVSGNGTCVLKNLSSNDNAGCSLWGEGKCLRCSLMYFFNADGVCTRVSEQCRSWDSKGMCTACYYGYDLADGNCGSSINFPDKLQVSQNLLCKAWRGDETCVECAERSYFNADGKCLAVSDFCQTWDKHDGFCLTCYKGYELHDNSKCVLSPAETYTETDPGCQSWKDAACVQCSKNWVFGEDGDCVPVSGLCKSSEGLACTSCYKGYTLNKGQCTITENFGSSQDIGCKIWDQLTSTCLQCSPSWYLNGTKCYSTSDLCKTYDANNGKCLSCFKGFNLKEGGCIPTPKNVQSADEGCAEWNWDKQECLTCGKYWFMKNGRCQQVSSFCRTYSNETGICTSCFTGFGLTNGQCQPSAASTCKTSSGSDCLTCFSGFALYQKRCVNLSQLADIKLYYAECCPQKLVQLRAEGRVGK